MPDMECDYCFDDHPVETVPCMDCGTHAAPTDPEAFCPWWRPLCMEQMARVSAEMTADWLLERLQDELAEKAWSEGWAA